VSLGTVANRKSVGRPTQSSFPAICATITAVKELVTASAWDFEADTLLAGEDGLAAFATAHSRLRLHISPHVPGLEFFVGEGLADGFQVLIGFLKTSTQVVDSSENRDVVDCDGHLSLVFLEELLNQEKV
jgi:hypothetical protein